MMGGPEDDEEENNVGAFCTQLNLLRRSEHTNKQLRRTHRRMLKVHKLLLIKREGERRLVAKGMKTTLLSYDNNGHHGGDDGRGI